MTSIRSLLLLAIALVLGVLPRAARAVPGDLDFSFGSGGLETTHISGNDGALGIAVQADGRIVLGGSSSGAFSAVRYTTGGTLDATFGQGGKVLLGAGNCAGVVSLPDGRIVLAGTYSTSNSSAFSVARLKVNGAYDGENAAALSAGQDEAYGVALQNDGKVVVVGTAMLSGNRVFALVRFAADLAVDTSFGTGGKVLTAMNTFAIARGVAVQPDGKIIVAGRVVVAGGGSTFGLARYTTSGVLDESFGTAGKVATVFSTDADGYGLLLDPEGRALVCGTSQGKLAVVRFLADGSVDPSFGIGGVTPPPAGDSFSIAYSIARQTDGSIAVGGYDYGGGRSRFVVARYTADGMLDGSFGAGGVVTTAAGASDSYCAAVAVQGDEKILAAGRVNGSNDTDFAAIRYLGDSHTEALTVNSPASGEIGGRATNVAFVLPEAAQSGTVTITFSGAQTRKLTLKATQATKGAHSFTIDPLNPGASSAVAAVEGGTVIPDGIYDLVFSYQDAWGNPAATSTSTGVRIDTVMPILNLPTDVVVEATGPGGAAVSYEASATDGTGSGLASSSFLPGSGAIFALGTTTVNAMATDKAGNTKMASFTVTVNDTTPPVVTVPENVTVGATGADGAEVSFAVTAEDTVDGSVVANVDHAPASVFPVGTTTVHAEATDRHGNKGQASFTVTVVASSDATLGLLGAAGLALRPAFSGGTTTYAAKVGYAVTAVTLSAAPNFPGATVVQTPANPVPLAVGPNPIQFVVTAQDGTSQTYALSLHRTAPDKTKPNVKISSPSGSKVTGPFTISGRVKEAIGLVSVTVQVNGGTPVAAMLPGDTGAGIAWSVEGWTPENGVNTILVTATDYNGNVGTATRTVAFNDPNVAEQAGTYLALIRPTGALNANYLGLARVQVSATGAFTGKGMSSGFSGSFRGVLRSDGVARFAPAQTTGIHLFDPVTKTYLGILQLAVVNGRLSGSLSSVPENESGPSVELVTFEGLRAPYSGANPVPASMMGIHHVVFDLKTPSGSLPSGAGFAVATISNSGGVNLAGSLADGTRLSMATALRADGTVPVFSATYRRLGAFIGTLSISTSADGDVGGDDFQWLRPEQPAAQYFPGGWPEGVEVTAFGARYVTPASLDFGQGDADPVRGNATLVFSEGNLSGELRKAVSVDPGPVFPGQVKLVPPNAVVAGYQFKLIPGTGVFSGSFSKDGATEIFRGVLLSRGLHRGGYGYFGLGGRVFLDPVGP